MIKEKLQKLQSLKKTSDLYTKPLFLLQNTEHLDIDTHRDMLSTDKYIKRNQLRETYTEQQEKKFNRKYSEYLKALVKKRADDCFGILIDFHIKFYRIDRYNRNELIFVLLPDYQIYERELGMLGVEPSWCGIIREMKNRQFYYVVMEYHRYDELFFKRLMYSFLESNEKLPSFYGLAALRAAKKMKDPVFLRYVYLSFKRKAGIEVKELETAVYDAIEMDEEKVMKGCDGQHEYISVQDVNRKQDNILVQCRDAVRKLINEYELNEKRDKIRKEQPNKNEKQITSGMEGTGHDVLVGMQNIRNYVVSISENELTEILLKKNIKGHFITNSIKIARNCNYDIVVPLLKLIEEVEDKRAILEYALDYYSTRRRVLQGSKMVSVLISSKAYIDDVLRSKLHDFLGKLTNKRSYNCAIEKLYENGLLDHVEVDMLDRTSRFVLDENIKDLDIANECLSVYQKGRKQQICNGYVIKDWKRTAENFWCAVLDTMDEIPSAMLIGAHLVHLFAVPEKYHCKILPLLARAINEDNCYEIARLVIDRDINHVEVLTLVYNYVKSLDLFNDQFYVSDEELNIILREHKDIKAVSMILQLVNNQVIEHIPFILPFLIQEKEFLCLERLVKRYTNIMIAYLQQFIEMGMNVKVFLYFDAESAVQKMIQMAAYDTLTDYIAVLQYIDQNTCHEILRTGNAGLIQPMILKIAQSKKECTEVHDLLKDERDESVREFIKKNAIESKILRNVVKEWI